MPKGLVEVSVEVPSHLLPLTSACIRYDGNWVPVTDPTYRSHIAYQFGAFGGLVKQQKCESVDLQLQHDPLKSLDRIKTVLCYGGGVD